MTRPSPTISVVTPSFNQARYLEECLRSVREQTYPAVEHLVIDGGSSDGSLEIIRRHADRLAYWTSEPDGGQYDAINKGFARAGGDVMGWLNSDDKYLPWALEIVADVFASLPEVEWISTLFPLGWDAAGRLVRCSARKGYTREAFLRGENLPGRGWAADGFIQQESTFWRRSLWERAGGALDVSYRLAADFELWARFYRHANLFGLAAPLGGFRLHPEQKTATQLASYLEEAEAALRRHGGEPPGPWRLWARTQARRLVPEPILRRLAPRARARICRRRGRNGGWEVSWE
jgi:glycosyltransferase involved in cell wall biosynthesis